MPSKKNYAGVVEKTEEYAKKLQELAEAETLTEVWFDFFRYLKVEINPHLISSLDHEQTTNVKSVLKTLKTIWHLVAHPPMLKDRYKEFMGYYAGLQSPQEKLEDLMAALAKIDAAVKTHLDFLSFDKRLTKYKNIFNQAKEKNLLDDKLEHFEDFLNKQDEKVKNIDDLNKAFNLLEKLSKPINSYKSDLDFASNKFDSKTGVEKYKKFLTQIKNNITKYKKTKNEQLQPLLSKLGWNFEKAATFFEYKEKLIEDEKLQAIEKTLDNNLTACQELLDYSEQLNSLADKVNALLAQEKNLCSLLEKHHFLADIENQIKANEQFFSENRALAEKYNSNKIILEQEKTTLHDSLCAKKKELTESLSAKEDIKKVIGEAEAAILSLNNDSAPIKKKELFDVAKESINKKIKEIEEFLSQNNESDPFNFGASIQSLEEKRNLLETQLDQYKTKIDDLFKEKIQEVESFINSSSDFLKSEPLFSLQEKINTFLNTIANFEENPLRGEQSSLFNVKKMLVILNTSIIEKIKSINDKLDNLFKNCKEDLLVLPQDQRRNTEYNCTFAGRQKAIIQQFSEYEKALLNPLDGILKTKSNNYKDEINRLAATEVEFTYNLKLNQALLDAIRKESDPAEKAKLQNMFRDNITKMAGDLECFRFTNPSVKAKMAKAFLELNNPIITSKKAHDNSIDLTELFRRYREKKNNYNWVKNLSKSESSEEWQYLPTNLDDAASDYKKQALLTVQPQKLKAHRATAYEHIFAIALENFEQVKKTGHLFYFEAKTEAAIEKMINTFRLCCEQLPTNKKLSAEEMLKKYCKFSVDGEEYNLNSRPRVRV